LARLASLWLAVTGSSFFIYEKAKPCYFGISVMVMGEGAGEQCRKAGFPREMKKSFRETINPLKTLKTAKSGVLRAQRYQ